MCHVCRPCHGAGIVSWSRNIYTPIFLLLGKGQSRPISPALLSLVQGCSSSTPINIYIPSIPCRIPSPARDFTGCFVLFVVQQLCHGCSDREFPVAIRAREAHSPLDVLLIPWELPFPRHSLSGCGAKAAWGSPCGCSESKGFAALPALSTQESGAVSKKPWMRNK